MSNTNIKKVRTSDLELKDRLVSIQRVTKVTKGGRTFSFSAIVVVGNENGVVGYGLGKASPRARSPHWSASWPPSAARRRVSPKWLSTATDTCTTVELKC